MFSTPQALWVMIQPKRKWELKSLYPLLFWLQCTAIGLLLMCLATISSWSCNSCTMLMLSRCSQRIKSCDNSIGKLGVIMENAESASDLELSKQQWCGLFRECVACTEIDMGVCRNLGPLSDNDSITQSCAQLKVSWVPPKKVVLTSKLFTDHPSWHNHVYTLSICWWKHIKQVKARVPKD